MEAFNKIQANLPYLKESDVELLTCSKLKIDFFRIYNPDLPGEFFDTPMGVSPFKEFSDIKFIPQSIGLVVHDNCFLKIFDLAEADGKLIGLVLVDRASQKGKIFILETAELINYFSGNSILSELLLNFSVEAHAQIQEAILFSRINNSKAAA